MKKYLTVAVLGWQDSLVYRFNAFIWILYAVLPSLTFMMIWLARYGSNPQAKIGGYTLPEMITYYLFVTALSLAITPNPEWDIAMQIRDGKITPFIVRPIGYYGYRLAQETAYQIIKTMMFLPAFALLLWLFRDYIRLPALDSMHAGLFVLSIFLAYALLTQIKFMLGLLAFWFAEVGGLLEIWNIMVSVFAGRLLPLTLLPLWVNAIGDWLPFRVLYDFPMSILLARADDAAIVRGLVLQMIWIVACAGLVHLMWRRGLLAYEAYGG